MIDWSTVFGAALGTMFIAVVKQFVTRRDLVRGIKEGVERLLAAAEIRPLQLSESTRVAKFLGRHEDLVAVGGAGLAITAVAFASLYPLVFSLLLLARIDEVPPHHALILYCILGAIAYLCRYVQVKIRGVYVRRRRLPGATRVFLGGFIVSYGALIAAIVYSGSG